MKRVVSLLLTVIMCALCLGSIAVAETVEVTFTPGTYEGKANSVGGEIVVSVTVSEHAIDSIEVVACNDSDGIKDVPVVRIPEQIVANQSLNVDAVSGATLTSMFLKNAIADAVKQATDNTDGLMEKVSYQAPAQNDMVADVVVVGGGSSGLAAAAQAGGLGLNVVLIERNAYLGGTSLICDDYMGTSAVEHLQAARNLMEEFMIAIEADYTSIDMGAATMYSFAAPEGHPATPVAIATMEAYAAKNNVTILKDTSATGLVIEDGKVVGVHAQPIGQSSFTVSAKAVILATGGFARNKAQIAKYMPEYENVIPCNLPGALGEAIDWVAELNAKLYSMDSDLQWYPTSAALMGHSFGSGGGIYVDAEGKLINETNFYSDTARDAYLKFGNKTYYQVLSQDDADAIGKIAEAERLLAAGIVSRFASLNEAAEAYDLAGFVDTMTGLGYSEDSTWYVCPVTAHMYSTYGGIEIDTQGHVLNTDDEIISGLYAAGEVTGSVDFKYMGTYMGQVGQGIQQGLIAAKTVAEDIK